MRILFSSIIIILMSSMWASAETTTVLKTYELSEKGAKKDLSNDYLGSSIKNAIVIEATNETDGVRAEYVWLAKHYPGYKTNKQSLLQDNGKYYDLLNITTASGEEKDFYFDINSFFGKF